MNISIQMLSNNKYEVTVQSNTITTHIVSLSDEEQLEKRRTREKDLIETFAKDDVDLDYANRWNAPLLKKKVKTKTMIIINSILVCIMIYLIVK